MNNVALSNWDSMAVNQNGQPILNCEFESPSGISVEIYKNWLYISDPRSWRKGLGFCKPTIMQINEGIVHYGDMEILALRGPQYGIYVVISSFKKDCLKTEDHTKIGMIGCGVSGYSSGVRSRWVGILPSSLRWFRKELNRQEKESSHVYSWIKNKKGKLIKKEEIELCKSYVHYIPDEFRNIDLLTVGKRSNQGDRFFAKHLGTPVQATKAGLSKATVFSQLLK